MTAMWRFLSLAGLSAFIACMATAQVTPSVRPRPAAPPSFEQFLGAWRFDNTHWQTAPHWQPLAALNTQLVPGWSGHALRIAGPDPALLALAEHAADGTTNLLADAGTIRFWFAPDWSSARAGGQGPGADVRLLESGIWFAQNALSWCSLTVDADGDSVQLEVHSAAGTETILSAAIAWNAGEWHQVALAWSAAAGTVLFLDGEAVAGGAAVTLLPAQVPGGVRGFSLGSDVWGTGLSKAQGEFDELYTFARVLAENQLAADYQRNAARAALGPILPGENQMMLSGPPAPPGDGTNGTNIVMTTVAGDYGCGLWLKIRTNTTNTVLLTLTNTVPGRSYRVWSKTNLSVASWVLETNLTGTSAQTWTDVVIPMNQRSNVFFFATALGGFATNKSFAGLNYTNSGQLAPDTMGAVGPDHFVQVLNPGGTTQRVVAVYDKCSGACVETATNTFFFGTTNRTVDARILYDHHAQRWVGCSLDDKTTNVFLAISKSSSPLGLLTNWTRYRLPITTNADRIDFPTLGIDKNGIYVSALISQSTTTNLNSHIIVALRKPDIYQGAVVSNMWNISTNEFFTWTIQPAVNFDESPAGGYAWFVAKQRRTAPSPYQGAAIYYRRLQWSGGTNSVPTWADASFVAIPDSSPSYRTYFDLDDGNVRAPHTNANQSTKVNLFTSGSRLQMAVIRDRHLWTCQHVGLDGTNGLYSSNDATGSNVNRSAVQWVRTEMSTNGNVQGTVNGRIYDSSSNPYWYYFPSVMVNSAGDMLAGFSGSRSNAFIGAFYSWRASNGTIPNQPVALRLGNGVFGEDRWGDYSYTSVDPGDGLTFWTVQEYAETETSPPSATWGTWIGEIVPDAPDP